MENQKDFLERLFEILQIPKNDQQGLRADLADIILANVGYTLITDLPSGKKETFIELLKKGAIDKESIEKWAKTQQIVEDKEFLQKLNSAVEKSVQDFFGALITDLDTQKREEVLVLARSYLK